MNTWREQLKFDPLPRLLSSKNAAITYLTRRDLLDEDAGPVQGLWRLPEAQKILKKQQSDGSWPRPGKSEHPAINTGLVETWRHLIILVEEFGFARDNPQVDKAAEYLFTCQTPDGDLRGMLANQYATYYTGAIMATLIQAGYQDDRRIEKGVRWLLDMRQHDGGWSIPLITHKFDRQTQYRLTTERVAPVEPDRSRPFSHNATGMVLRAFAAHGLHRKSEAARTAAHLLSSRFFQADAYVSYHAASYWVRFFPYPFWWNNLVAALDTVSSIGMTMEDERIHRAVDWLVLHQEEDGLWRGSYAKPEDQQALPARAVDMSEWIGLAICRVLKRLLG